MMPFQLDPRRYYPDAQEQSILIPYLRKYFKFPERSPERNRIASEVSNMLSKFSPHWTHRAVRLWFNNNRTTYIKAESSNNNGSQNQQVKSNPINMSQNLTSTNQPKLNSTVQMSQKPKVGLPPISCFASAPNSAMQSSLPSIEEFSLSSNFPHSITTIPRGSSSDNMFSPHSNFNTNGANSDFASLLNEANQCSQDLEKFAPLSSKINQMCDEFDFRIEWPKYSNTVEFPPHQFSYDLSSLLNSSPRIWINKKFNETELPKIDFYAVDSGMDSYIIDDTVFIHKGSEFVQVSNRIPPEVSCYTTSEKSVWAVTRSKEIYRIDISNFASSPSDAPPQEPEVIVSATSLPSSSSNSSLSSSERNSNESNVSHEQLSLPFHSSQIRLCPCDDKIILYSHDSSLLTVASPDMKIESARIMLLSPCISILKAMNDYSVCSMKGNVAVSLNDLNTGAIIRHFLGHYKEPNHLHLLDDKLLASSAKDSNVRLWDFNNKEPVMTLKTPKKNCKGITGTRNVLITCLENATVNVVDLRMPNESKPLMAFNLENSNSSVNPMTINYVYEENSLNLFLNEIVPKAKLRYVYRTYTNLLS